MLTRWTTELLAWLSCSANSLLAWLVPLHWIGSVSSMSGPQITVLPKTKGTLLRKFKIFRSKRI